MVKKLGRLIETTKQGDIRKTDARPCMYYAWRTGSTVARAFYTLENSRKYLGIDTTRKERQ